MFEDAGKHLFNGELDPRLLISYYPDLRGSLFTPDDSMDVFAGVAEHMPSESSVDDISKSERPTSSLFYFSFLGNVPAPVDVETLFSPFHCVPVLELIFSCLQPSQELLPSLSPQYSRCSSNRGVEKNIGNGGKRDAGSVPEEEPDKTQCCEGHRRKEFWRSP